MSKKKLVLAHGNTFLHRGDWFKVTHHIDEGIGPPERMYYGHGDVSVLRTRETDEELAAQGYWVLRRERTGHVTVYNARMSLRMAVRDDWGRGKSLSAKRRAVRRDYQYLRGWYTDEWHWVGVEVERLTGDKQGSKDSLWGIESCSVRYLSDVARELADGLIEL